MISPRTSSTESSTSYKRQFFEAKNSENAFYESQRELESQKTTIGSQSEQAPKLRDHTCVADRGSRTIFIKSDMQKVDEKLKFFF